MGKGGREGCGEIGVARPRGCGCFFLSIPFLNLLLLPFQAFAFLLATRGGESLPFKAFSKKSMCFFLRIFWCLLLVAAAGCYCWLLLLLLLLVVAAGTCNFLEFEFSNIRQKSLKFLQVPEKVKDQDKVKDM